MIKISFVFIKRSDYMLKNIFKKKSKKEKEIRSLEIKLSNKIAKRDFLKPRIKKSFFKNDEYESVPISLFKEIEELDEEIISLKEKICEIKKI